MVRETPLHNAPMSTGPSMSARPAARRKARRWRVAGWLLPVLMLHALALYGLSRSLQAPSPDALPPVLYTRVLLPQATPAARSAPSAGGHEPSPPQSLPNPGRSAGTTLLARQAAAQRPRRATSRPPSTASGAQRARTGRSARGEAPHAPRHAASSPQVPASDAASRAPAASAPAHVPAAARAPLPAHASMPPQASAPARASAPAQASPVAHGPAALPGSAPASSAAARTPPARQHAWPASTRLDFALTGYYRGALHGNGQLEWRHDGSRYFLRLSGSALIDFAYTSSGSIDGAWLAPDQYSEQVLFRRKTVDFDRNAALLRFSAMAGTMPIPAHLQDSASVFMQLSQALRTRPQDFVAGREIRLLVARPTGTTTWTFRIAGHADVPTGVGRLDCWHLVYDPPADADMGAEVWLAPALQDLPVQIRLRHGGDDYLLFTLRRALQQGAGPKP